MQNYYLCFHLKTDSLEHSLTRGNSSMINMIDYISLENYKPTKSTFDDHSSRLTTLYQQNQTSKNSERSSRNRRSKSYGTSDGISKCVMIFNLIKCILGYCFLGVEGFDFLLS